MYRENFVVFLKVGNGILREQKDQVVLPFGSEYKIGLKNMNTTRAAVRVFIDDVDVLNGSKIIIDPNDDVELEGFLSGSKVTHRFKFIEKTEQISAFRGDRAGDGLLRVEYEFERKPDVHNHVYTHHHPWHSPLLMFDTTVGSKPRGLSYDITSSTQPCSFDFNGDTSPQRRRLTMDSPQATNAAATSQPAKDGITVKGSASNQNFKNGYLGAMEGVKHVICLKLMGTVSEKKQPTLVREPLPVTITPLPDYNGVPMRLIKVGSQERIASLEEIDAVRAELQAMAEEDASKKGDAGRHDEDEIVVRDLRDEK